MTALAYSCDCRGVHERGSECQVYRRTMFKEYFRLLGLYRGHIVPDHVIRIVDALLWRSLESDRVLEDAEICISEKESTIEDSEFGNFREAKGQ